MGNWGSYIQGNDKWADMDELGSLLSIAIDCGIHYPSYGLPKFECQCGVLFPLYVVRGRDWKAIVQYHIDMQDVARRSK